MSCAPTGVPLSPTSTGGTRDESAKERDTQWDSGGTPALENLLFRPPAIETGGTLGGTDGCHPRPTMHRGSKDSRDNGYRG
jgi:hypothetical protein